MQAGGIRQPLADDTEVAFNGEQTYADFLRQVVDVDVAVPQQLLEDETAPLFRCLGNDGLGAGDRSLLSLQMVTQLKG